MRYQPKDPTTAERRKTLLLIHGLAHSGRVFWAETIDENFVQYFLKQNYDVWIVDHRTSPNYVPKVTSTHTWDDIALQDIPNAVNFIFDTINEGNGGRPKKVHVFSHCIGSGAACIALLNGKLKDSRTGECKIASIVPHAVTPWLYASVENRARENLWALFKEQGLFDVIEPFPHRDTPFKGIMLDRIVAGTLNDVGHEQWCREECE